MTETEGTIQFGYGLEPGEIDETLLSPELLTKLAGWRSILYELQLVGQTPERYQGYAYGNISARVTPDSEPAQFVVTASQTSGAKRLFLNHLVLVREVNLDRFWVDAVGSEPPSSESVTHAMLYAADPRIRYVFHIHSTEIWQTRESLGLPQTPADVPYGSPQMTEAVAELLHTHQSRPLVFATAGHEDGIFACGTHARDCGGLLVSYLAKARQIILAGSG